MNKDRFSGKEKSLKLLSMLLIVVSLTMTSCGQKKQENSGDQEKKQDQKKAMSALEDLEKQNEQIIKQLKGPAVVQEEEGQQEQGQTKDQQQQGQEQQGQGKEQGQQEEQGGQQKEQGQQEEQGGQQKQQGQQGEQEGQQQKGQEQQKQGQEKEQKVSDKEWETVNQSIVELHKLFNDYLPMANKLGANPELNKKATETLNNLTKKAENKNNIEALIEANRLYGYISDFYALQQDKSAPLKKALYNARSIMIASMVSDWKTADSAMTELKNLWQSLRVTFDEKQKDLVTKLDLSIADMEGVVAQKDANLVQIKGNILMQNISEIEKGIKEQQEQKEQ